MDMNVNEAVELFFMEFLFPKDSKNTQRTYKTALIKFLQYAEEDHFIQNSVSTLNASVISRFGAWIIRQNLSEYTQNIYESALRRAINFWRIKGLISFSNDEEKDTRLAMRITSKKRGNSTSPRVGRVPEDFGDRMALEVDSIPILISYSRLQKLNILRARALIHILRATALRIGDACRLTKNDFLNAKSRGGYFTLQMQKTGSLAHCFLGEPSLRAIERYVQERVDTSPWIFIQHGRAGKSRAGTSQFFRTSTRGYGSRISTKTAWEIIRKIGKQAYGSKTRLFLSPHAFRHWHAQTLIHAGARLEDVQSVLGHANPVVTKQIYAPEPDLTRISEKENAIQASPESKKIPRADEADAREI
jgi:site-specific recombinase XerD